MRRAAAQVLRTVRRPAFRKFVKSRSSVVTPSSYALGLRFASARREIGGQTLASSMRLRRVSVAVVTTLVGGGAFYAYRGSPSKVSEGSVGAPFAGGSPVAQSVGQNRSFSTTSAFAASPQASPSGALPKTAPEPARRALIVEQGELYTGTIDGDGPLLKETDDYGRKVLEMMTPEQATQKLRTNEQSYLVGRGKGVVRYDVVQIPSNNPIEDDHAEKILEVPQSSAAAQDGTASSDWMFWGVFDGHSGWTTSAKLRQVLISFVARELNETYKSALTDPAVTFPTPESVDNAIKKGFVRLDHEITHESVNKVLKAQSKRVAAELLAPALSGSCALLSFYDSRSKLLRVACTGDSRAVLGRRGTSGKWIATPLSVDQTGENAEEIARLRKEHPGEPYVTHNGRILGGLEPSRAFGDAVYKWTKETQDKIKNSYFGRTPSKYLKTPPYVTAEPVITTTKVEPEKGDFVVMATDGLWEMLTNEEVVGLVGQWLEAEADGRTGNSNSRKDSWLKSWFSTQKMSVLPVEQNGRDTDPGGQRAPIRQQQWGVTAPQNERFVVQDKNAATHLVRNALGGKDQDMVCALLTLPSPYSRRYRDDLTVEAIFFGEGDKSGDVELNNEASAREGGPKARL